MTWLDNKKRLLAIKENNPHFWTYIVAVTKQLETTNRKYIDDHSWSSQREEEIDTVMVVQTFTKDDKLKSTTEAEIRDIGMLQKWNWLSTSWLRMHPGEYIDGKNPLYIDADGRVHLSTCAQGIDVQPKECDTLRCGYMLQQKRGDWSNWNDHNFILPYSVFRDVVMGVDV